MTNNKKKCDFRMMHDAILVGCYLYDKMTGIFTYLFYCTDKIQIKALKSKNYDNIKIFKNNHGLYYIEIIDY